MSEHNPTAAAPMVDPESLRPQVEYRIKYTLDGEVAIRATPEGGFEEPLRTADLLPLPPKINVQHISDMRLFFTLMSTIKKNWPNRKVPVTRKEFMNAGASERLYRDLLSVNLLKETLLMLHDDKTGKPIEARAVVYFTPQGRAFVREHISPEYAITGNR